jgi:flagellar protein FlaG
MSSSGIPDGLSGDLQSTGNMPAQAPASHLARDVAPNRKLAPEVDVAVKTNLGEPIDSLASEAKSERESSLRSIEGVAADIREAIDTLNSALEKAPTKAIISRDEQLNRFIVKIADERSGEIVREIPSEAVLKFARNLQEIKGLLFDAEF